MKTTLQSSILTIITLAAITLSACQKQPSAEFTTDKAEYTAGETVKLTNTSVDGKTYKWTLPDGQTSNAANVDYTLNENQSDATLSFKLEALSKNGKKTDEASKSVTVKAAKGKVTFWQRTGSGFGITVVSINGVSSNITSEYSSTPSCGDAGCAVFSDLKIGAYAFTASDGTSSWNGNVTITKDGCLTMELQ